MHWSSADYRTATLIRLLTGRPAAPAHQTKLRAISKPNDTSTRATAQDASSADSTFRVAASRVGLLLPIKNALVQMRGPPSGNLPEIEPGSTPPKAAPNSVHQANTLTAILPHTAVMRGAMRDKPLSPQGAIQDNPLMRPPIDLIKLSAVLVSATWSAPPAAESPNAPPKPDAPPAIQCSRAQCLVRRQQ